MAAPNISFKIDLQQNYDFDLSSFQRFEVFINGIPSPIQDPTQKAIIFLQKYLSKQKSLNGKNMSIARREFLRLTNL